jgi:hypothetical protein
MAVVFLKYANRLAPCVSPKGVSRSEAMARADANVMTLRDAGLDQIDGCLGNIKQQMHALTHSPDQACKVIYDKANIIGGVSALFGLPELGSVAYGICDLMIYFEDGGEMNIDAIKLHIFTLDLFRHPKTLKIEQINTTIKNLAKLRAHILGSSSIINS